MTSIALSRRALLGTLAAAALPAGSAPPAFAAQLYTIRSLLRREPDRALQAVAAMGFKDVEGYGRAQFVALAPKLKQAGLAPRACTIETPLLTANWEQFPDLKQISPKDAIDSLAAIGTEFCIMGYIPPGARGDGEDFYRRTADRMNVAAELCHKAGTFFVLPSILAVHEGFSVSPF